MENRIRRITVFAEHQTPTTEVRGRLMGPCCPYASTVEVAYPLHPLSGALGALTQPRSPALGALTQPRSPEPAGLTRRVIVPEASFWEPQCPFLYQGPIELWQDGQRRDRVIVKHGMRSFQLTERGLHVNGRPLTPHGRRIAACSEEKATGLRQTGYNLFIAPVTASSLAVWEQADRFGFLVLGQLGEDADETRLVETLCPHASCLGWLRAECRALSAEEAVGWYMVHGNPEPM